eukprot:262123_1
MFTMENSVKMKLLILLVVFYFGATQMCLPPNICQYKQFAEDTSDGISMMVSCDGNAYTTNLYDNSECSDEGAYMTSSGANSMFKVEIDPPNNCGSGTCSDYVIFEAVFYEENNLQCAGDVIMTQKILLPTVCIVDSESSAKFECDSESVQWKGYDSVDCTGESIDGENWNKGACEYGMKILSITCNGCTVRSVLHLIFVFAIVSVNVIFAM